ncbi:MAG: class II aldolase/adducin family protein [Actinobacteria bacterium]|nr:class II aldolase/adducin family protein [Actinomycetota bacterium]
MTTDDPRALVSLGSRVLGNEDQSDLVWGHLSLRDPDGRGVWMKRSTIGFDEVGPDDVLLVGRAGDVLAGDGRRHAEYPIHTEIMAARPDVGAVVHSHARSAVAFASLGVPLRPVSHEGTLFTPPDVPRFTDTGDLIVTAALGQRVAEVLGDRNALLLVNHGIVVAAPDVPTAVTTAILLDRACAIQLTAMAAGDVRHWSSDEEARAKRDHCYSAPLLRQAWDHLVRRLPA